MLRVIVSRGTKSLLSRIKIGENYEFAAGNELIIDDEVTGSVTPVEITSLESGGKRLERALAANIDTVWARAIDEVTVKIAISSGRTTRSIELRAPGEQEFRVGDSGTSDGIEYRIHSILQRDGASKDREGSVAQAKSIKRIYAKLLGETQPKIRKRSERVAIRSKGMPVWSLKRKESA